ncbi:hypothetical protein N7492_007070 [Penicillium capsulatum]|uniref:AA1-like domain-containing protein n=1 Tax=Penicillium capsulatum TaxID=69766 RepID=A0A9W9HZ70_9EURO|nr:hypothetical protein N7492_007070 [Penicillium capsulatum]KAJ6116904.1 hypothetical protein N7512_006629 [Penicillium capsulatum]
MHFSKTISAAVLALGPMAAHAAFPVASIQFNSWEQCDVGAPAHGEAKFKADVTATPVTCDKTTVNRDWSINNYSFRTFIDTKDALLCEGVTVWNNDDCSGRPAYFQPLGHGPVTEGQCLSDFLDPGFVSFKLECHGFGGPGAGGHDGPGGPGAGPDGPQGGTGGPGGF